MGGKSAPVDLEIAWQADTQHGVITTRQLAAIGLSRAAISKRARRGRLHRLHQGVYAVGHRLLSEEARWMAAVLTCGEEAVLSHGSAAALWGLLQPRSGPVDISIPSHNGRRRRQGIRLHRSASLRAHLSTTGLQKRPVPLVTLHNGIPVTTSARTIADLKRVVPAWEWRKAVRQAEFKELDLGAAFKTNRTRSDLEADFLRLCRRHGFPAPEVNVKVGGWTVDFLWREHRIAVETDFYGYHRGRVAFQDDHARDLALRRLGLDVRRYSEQQLNEQPEAVVADLREALTLIS